MLAVAVKSGASGAENVYVDGRAPAYSVVKLDVSATITRDLPTIRVTSLNVNADETGRFATIIAVAPEYQRGIVITVRASINGGNVTATAATVMTPPNSEIPVSGWDQSKLYNSTHRFHKETLK